jgi:F0F1-type ATP synthase assembly protein I
MNEKFERGQKQVNNYLRYSGIGFQIAATIGVGVFIGYQLDKWVKTPQPYFTLGFSFVFLILGLYIGLKDFGKKAGPDK